MGKLTFLPEEFKDCAEIGEKTAVKSNLSHEVATKILLGTLDLCIVCAFKPLTKYE